MKSLGHFAFILFAVAVISSCDEIGPNINLKGNTTDTTGGTVDTTQQKKVLIEDFTATDCTNCPSGRAIIDGIVADNPGRIDVIEYHQGQLSYPLLPGDPALKTPDAESLASLFQVSFWPSAAINRERFAIAPGDTEIAVDRSYWVSYVQQELDSVLKIKMGLDIQYNSATSQLSGTVTVDFLQTIYDDLNISIALTESGIQAAQLDLGVIDSNYIHHNVLRDMLTSFSGDYIDALQTEGSQWVLNMTPYTLSSDWNPDSCHVVAFVTRAAGSYQVLQSVSAPLK